MTDNELIVACIEFPANRLPVARVVERFSVLVHKVISWTLRRYGRFSNENAEDIYQDFFFALFDNGRRILRSYDPGRGQVTTFFAALARNRSINFCKRSRMVSAVDPDWLEDEKYSPHRALEYRENQETLNRAVKGLTSRDQLFYKLYFAEFMPIEEIAEIMGTARDTVYSQKAKIVSKLRSAVTTLLADPISGGVHQ
jgi:RNA polymerase sigma factor (sigma-70 family)